ncbi:phospholipase B1, membrane-associated-like [Branchiostoma lanceolatum]|uniref:phospholipase B1, membrane-associated-like n=1 Tax=Branchiostoma lanceolatum TaxID=7740 RepID=UPI003451D4A0
MKSSKEIDYSNDWKVVTLLVSAHDLCEDCQNKENRSPDNYVTSIRAALDILKAEVPRTFVNLVPVMSMHLFHRDLADNRTQCERIGFKYSSRSCACNDTAGEKDLAEGANPDYTPLTRELLGDGRYDNSDAFTVVLQPFMQEFLLPKQADGEPDLSFFAPDCFHLGEKVHEKAAIGLWNSMIEPVGKKAKQTDWQKGEPLKCPTVEYLPTTKNTYDLSESCSIQHRWRSATFLDIQDSLFCWRHS